MRLKKYRDMITKHKVCAREKYLIENIRVKHKYKIEFPRRSIVFGLTTSYPLSILYSIIYIYIL